MIWPPDADGDVFRRLEHDGFDFGKPHLIDFNVDFDSWPPNPEAVALLRAHYPSTTIYEPDGESSGYALVQVHSRLDYDYVVEMQKTLSNLMEPHGGSCESWGVTA
jgi:hypothetical protein